MADHGVPVVRGFTSAVQFAADSVVSLAGAVSPETESLEPHASSPTAESQAADETSVAVL